MQSRTYSDSLEARMAELLSDHEYPSRWYHGNGTTVCFAILTTLLGYLSVFVFGFGPPLSVRFVSVLFVLACTLTDSITTYRAFALQHAFEERGLEFPIYEANPLMSERPTPREIFLGKPRVMVAIAVGLTLFIPLAGWGIGLYLLTVSLGNHRNRQQADYELRMYDDLIHRNFNAFKAV